MTPEMVKKIHKAVLEDRRLKVRELADKVVISKSVVHLKLSENLDMRKLYATMDTLEGLRIFSDSKLALEAVIDGGITSPPQ
ncbi:hypothetical protein TNCV_974471 [Trichonephila clavipes]|nr:hypothetical protein TNCV_974471 [Trichonephila clavipes]